MRTQSKWTYIITEAVIIVLSVLLAIYWGNRKQGYFIDENYSYTISNGTQLGIAIKSGEWNDTDAFLDQMISTGDENFHFAQACENTANDVHPPVYYILFHLISSIFTGVYSKWIGLSLNIILLIPILITVNRLAYELSGEDKIISLIATAFYGLAPATMAHTVFIRMYMLLSLWTLIYAYIHVCDLKRDRLSFVKFILPSMITCYLGFLTQYFYVVIMFFITFIYAFYLAVFCHRIKDGIVYGLSILLSLILAAISWPICKFHIFKGYRGKGAVDQLFNFRDYIVRTKEYLSYLNRQVFGGLLVLFVLFLITGVAVIIVRIVNEKKSGTRFIVKSLPLGVRGMILLGMAAVLDFIVIAQTGLLAGEASCRHMYMAYALFMVLVPIGCYMLIRHFAGNKKQVWYGAVAVMLAVPIILGYVNRQVIFTYEDEKIANDYAISNPDAKVVVFQSDDGMYDSRIQEFVKYPTVYFASTGDLSTAVDDTIAHADELLVYMPMEGVDEDACLNSIYEQNPGISRATLLWVNNDFFKAYLLD